MIFSDIPISAHNLFILNMGILREGFKFAVCSAMASPEGVVSHERGCIKGNYCI
jgi:hypothetical protein